MVLSQRKISICHGNRDDSSCTESRNGSWGLESLLAECAWTSAHQWCLPLHTLSFEDLCHCYLWKTKHLHTANIFQALEVLLTDLLIEAKKTQEVENFHSPCSF